MSETATSTPKFKPLSKRDQEAFNQLPFKRQQFVKHYTDPKLPTFGNGSQSVLATYPTVTSPNVAKSMASEILTNPDVVNIIQRKLRTKEEDQDTLQKFVDKLELQLKDGSITPENNVLLRELREFITLQGKFRGDFVEKSINLNVNVDRANLSSMADEILRDAQNE